MFADSALVNKQMQSKGEKTNEADSIVNNNNNNNIIINTCNGGGGEISDCETGAAGEEDCTSLFSFTLSLRTLREANETDIIDQILIINNKI